MKRNERIVLFVTILAQTTAWLSVGRRRWTLLKDHNVVDAEFERVQEPSAPKTTKKTMYKDDFRKKTLVDLAIEADPELSEIQVPFVEGENYIPARLSFTVDVDGETYAIGTPFESPVAIVVEEKDGTVKYMSPDDDQNTELMEIMATQVKEQLGDEFRLKRTPRVLTVSGPLDEFTKNWQQEALPEPVSAEDLLNDDDEDIDSFMSFMRKELGDEEVDAVLKDDNDDLDEGLMSLFSVPGLGADEDNAKGVEEILKSMFNSPEEIEDEAEKELAKGLEDTALKLISYKLPKGKEYSLVKFTKPFTLLGKLVEREDSEPVFQMIPRQEEEVLIPRLEKICKDNLERIGMKLSA